jgi:hypothetical protein
MTNIEWSDNQPPEWQPSSPPPAPKLPESEVLEPWTFGQVMSKTWEALTSNFKLILNASGIGLAIYSIFALAALAIWSSWSELSQDFVNVVVGVETSPEIPIDLLLQAGGLNLLLSLLAVVMQFWMVAKVGNQMLGSTGASGWGRLMGANFLFGFTVFVVLLPLAIGIFFATESSPELAGGLSFLLFFLVGYLIYVSLGLIPLTGVVLAEGIGGFKALQRSLALGKGYRLKMFGPLLVYSLFAGIISSAFTMFAALEIGLLSQLVVYAIGLGISVAIASAISAAVSVVIYQNQLRRKS